MSSKAYDEVVCRLTESANNDNLVGMARYGISTKEALGVPMPALRMMAKRIGKDHELAIELWNGGLHEGRILASLVADPLRTDRDLMESWARQFDSWDVCDQVCSNLFSKAPHSYDVIPSWTADEGEFVRRAGFVMMAVLAVHDKRAADEEFLRFFPLIEAGASDARNYVKKAVNWAIRQMGKRNLELRRKCVELSERIMAQGTESARWIAADAIRELNSPKVMARLEAKERRQNGRSGSSAKN